MGSAAARCSGGAVPAGTVPMVISKRERARFHLGRFWRTHHDTDIGVCRQDLVLVAELLEDWDFLVTYEGELQQ